MRSKKWVAGPLMIGRLRVKDIDFGKNQIVIRRDEGGKDRLWAVAHRFYVLQHINAMRRWMWRCYRRLLSRGRATWRHVVMQAIDSYLQLRRAAGFQLRYTETPLKDFARFATERSEIYTADGGGNCRESVDIRDFRVGPSKPKHPASTAGENSKLLNPHRRSGPRNSVRPHPDRGRVIAGSTRGTRRSKTARPGPYGHPHATI